MPSIEKMDNLYMDIAERVAQMSHGVRLKVGSVIAKNTNIVSYGWNGMPAGMDNSCEDEQPDGTLVTKREVMHSESNAIAKLVAGGGAGAQGGTLYTVYSPCFECSKLIKQAGIARVVYRNEYRDAGGIKFLKDRGVVVEQLKAVTPMVAVSTPEPKNILVPAATPAQRLEQFHPPSEDEVLALLRQHEAAVNAAVPTAPTVENTVTPTDTYRSSFL